MAKSAWSVCGVLALLLVAATAPPAPAENEGQTIFGEDKKETLKAMRGIAKALDVNCTHCHVKDGGKIVYEKDTPEKQVARKMKFGFVDTLPQKGKFELEVEEKDGKTKLLALYKAKGDDAGIHLTAITADGKTHKKILPLPEEGAELNCMTCHNRQLHFLTHEDEKGKEKEEEKEEEEGAGE